ncbi:MAG: diaminopropionate ammonia-lyase [Paracoccaceae bacterium]|nr:diaminopropionate ammonia-lyase [Paracoccaceae bacterium]
MSSQDIIAASARARISKAVWNKTQRQLAFPDLATSLNGQNMAVAKQEISSWLGYAPTPLHSLPSVAVACGVKAVLYKDEATRFGLGSFKALGGAYAVASLVAAHKAVGKAASELTVTTATDGNHGRSVAWGAHLAGCTAKIYIHKHVSLAREQAMHAFGADVIRINGNYEASLAACKCDAEAHGWQIVSDTSWEGYRDIPLQVMAGYSVMASETLDQMGDLVLSHVILPIGVGGMAAGIVAPIWQSMGDQLCKIVSVESDMSPCFQESITAQTPTFFDISEETLMAGLSCGEVSQLAWEILEPTISHCLSIPDDSVAPLMRALGRGLDGSPPIEAGECSTAGLAALLAAKKDPALWADLGFDRQSVVLLIGTEGATDPELYQSIMNSSGVSE